MARLFQSAYLSLVSPVSCFGMLLVDILGLGGARKEWCSGCVILAVFGFFGWREIRESLRIRSSRLVAYGIRWFFWLCFGLQ